VNARKRVLVGIGEVLWDFLPAGRQLGGAPANFALHARELGADAYLISRIGRDALGEEILQRMREAGLPDDGISLDAAAATGTVAVELAADGQPLFTIHENAAWDFLAPTAAALSIVRHADAVCFGTLGRRCPGARAAIRSLVTATPPGALRIFDINLRQQYYSKEIIKISLEEANFLKLSDQELPVLKDLLELKGNVHAQIEQLAHRYGLILVALTRGACGSLLHFDGRWSDNPGLKTEVADTVGAGDAFTAALAQGFLAGWDIEAVNNWANEIACYVCSQAGATPRIPSGLKRTGVNQ
jgi:fructokinase